MRRHIVLIWSLAVIAVLSVWAFAEGGASTLTRLAPPIDDSAIQKCIEDKLAASATLKADGISVAVTNGVATLTGHVKNMGSKGAATNLAKSCGPKSIANNITVEKAAPIDDGAIQKCITDKFAASGSLNPQGFSATVSSGVATLTGTAKDAGSKGAATNIAKKCGAKKVTNNISAPAVSKHK
jgi:osmotically-inducible protein OsmY